MLYVKTSNLSFNFAGTEGICVAEVLGDSVLKDMCICRN